MEVVKEYLISRVSSLVEKIKTCEEERNSILLEVKNLKNTANNSEACGIFEKTCQNLEEMLENLVVPIKNCGECETSKREGQKIKCRYYNRGFCKYRENCKFFHSTVMCKTYLAEGTCNKVACYDRHPKVCKFWAGSSKGCPRNASCEFLHECIGNVKNHENSNDHCDDCGLDQDKENHRKVHTDASPYQQRNGEGEITNRGYQECHRDSNETEESYRIVKDHEGKIQFTCKECEKSFASQKSIIQHYTAKRGGRHLGQLANHQ